MLKGHGGNIYDLARQLNCRAEDIVDLSSNLNPLGPPPGLREHLTAHLDDITALPEVDAARLSRMAARRMGIDAQRILAANGTTQFIYALPLVLGLKKVLIVGPTYSDYADACRLSGCRPAYMMTGAESDFKPDIEQLTRLSKDSQAVFICNPNNPTGAHIAKQDLAGLFNACPETLFIVDESYLPFHEAADDESCSRMDLPNIIILSSMSKIFRVPGLRIGFLIAASSVTEAFRPRILPWSVNSLACAAAEFLLGHAPELATFIADSRSYIHTAKKRFQDRFDGMDQIRLFTGHGPFLLARLSPPTTAADICHRLAADRLLIRNCQNFEGLTAGDIRFSFKSEETNAFFSDALMRALQKHR